MKNLSRAYWSGYLLWQIFLARVVTIDFFDAAANLLNGRTLAGPALGYTSYRPPLLPLLHAPLIKLLTVAGAGPAELFWAPHVFQVFLNMACLAAVYVYLRRFLPESWARLGTILFSLDRLTVHYFFSVMTDIPCALFLLGAYLLATGVRRRPVAACLSLAACLLCRWNMLAAPAALAAAAPFLRREGRARAVAIAAGSLVLFVVVNVAVYHRALGLGPVAATRFLIETLLKQFRANSGREPVFAYARSLWAGSGPALCALFALGAAGALAAGAAEARWQLAFLVYFFALMEFVVGHKESRYLYPALPIAYLFALLGLKELHARIRRARPPWAAAFVAAVAACSVAGAAREWARFADPVYRSATPLASALVVDESAGPGGNVYWFGFVHSIVPREPMFTPTDAFYYLYHVPCPDLLEYLTGRRVRPLPREEELKPGDVIVRAPARAYRLERPISPAEDRLFIWRAGEKRRLELVAAFD